MAETAALLADEILSDRPLRQWVLSLPHALRFLLARNPAAFTQVLGVVYRAISGRLPKRAGLTRATGHTSAVTLMQRFGSELKLNIHFHMLFLTGRRTRPTGPSDPRRTPRRAHRSRPGKEGPDRARHGERLEVGLQ